VSASMAGAVLGGLAVALGAFGAHGLKERLSAEHLQVFEVGVRYQLYHALALLLVAALLRGGPGSGRTTLLFLWGSVVFSGSLYALAFGAPRAVGMITPLGGLALIGGWISLAVAARGL